MKLYTRRGDQGQTDLFGGQTASKDDLRVETYGQVDELNCVIGLALTACSDPELTDILRTLQHQLFELGADLATPLASPHADRISRIGQSHIAWLEQTIDTTWARLPEMKTFILPGGSELSARLHVARAVCRRVERACVSLARVEPLGPHAVIYLNRLGDLLFALARRANQLTGLPDVPWPGQSASH